MKISTTLKGLMALIILLPTMAFAHSKVNSSNPESGSQVSAGLETLELNFTKAVRVTRFGLHRAEDGMSMGALMDHEQDAAEVLDNMGEAEVPITSDMPNGFGTELAVTFDGLDAGIYHYAWIAVAQDGHLMEGQGHFEVMAAE